MAILLAAVWLLATHHAVLEITGFMPDGVSDASSKVHDGSNHPHERWHHAEKTASKQRTQLSDAFVLSLIFICFSCLPQMALVRVPTPPQWAVRARQCLAWIPSWTFSRRAVPAIRAP